MTLLPLTTAIRHLQSGAALLDLRPIAEYAAGHVPGSLQIDPTPAGIARLPTLLAPDQPLVLICDAANPPLAAFARYQVLGYLPDLQEWQAHGLPIATGNVMHVTAAELADLQTEQPTLQIVDVREKWETAGGFIPAAHLIPLGSLVARQKELDRSVPVALVCAAGVRSQKASYLLAQQGFTGPLYNLMGGMQAWLGAGLPLA
jgi:hydroxyacylglutathione hydrolase